MNYIFNVLYFEWHSIAGSTVKLNFVLYLISTIGVLWGRISSMYQEIRTIACSEANVLPAKLVVKNYGEVDT